MDKTSLIFMKCLYAGLHGRKFPNRNELTPNEWTEVLQLALKHNLLQIVLGTIYDADAVKQVDPELVRKMSRITLYALKRQAAVTAEFLQLYTKLVEAGVHPVVVKGLVCQNLYPNPDSRYSGDVDLFIREDEFDLCHDVLTTSGLQLAKSDKDIHREHEVPYRNGKSPLYIEVHKSLFPPESEAYGDLNRFFEGAHERTVRVQLKKQHTSILTLEYTDNLQYLIFHAFKHFLHSGFGLRQVCDITMFANVYGTQINWNQLLENCRQVHADVFTAALLKIGAKYLGLHVAYLPIGGEWKRMMEEVDETDLLNELLDGGIFGDSSMSRIHSSNITLNAVASQKQGDKANAVKASLFPSAQKLSGRYSFLKRASWLLPFAWADRLIKYSFEISKRKKMREGGSNDALESLQIGRERIALLKEYKIIK